MPFILLTTHCYVLSALRRNQDSPLAGISNIVHFKDCFKDNDNVYMTLELCSSGSLMDMLRRSFVGGDGLANLRLVSTVQLIGACHYMRTHQVIHRDLKLGNLFLDSNMNVKVGDFGLAALIEYPGEWKKTKWRLLEKSKRNLSTSSMMKCSNGEKSMGTNTT